MDSYKANGKQVGVWLRFRNTSEKGEVYSSLMQFQATSHEGDNGEMSWGDTKCDGTVPPHGLFKCLLVYTFPTRPNSVTLMVGAGFLANEVYFELTMPEAH